MKKLYIFPLIFMLVLLGACSSQKQSPEETIKSYFQAWSNKDVSKSIELTEGKDSKNFTLIKKDKNAPWLIDSFGY